MQWSLFFFIYLFKVSKFHIAQIYSFKDIVMISRLAKTLPRCPLPRCPLPHSLLFSFNFTMTYFKFIIISLNIHEIKNSPSYNREFTDFQKYQQVLQNRKLNLNMSVLLIYIAFLCIIVTTNQGRFNDICLFWNDLFH